jgi:serine/threonine-protein kinase
MNSWELVQELFEETAELDPPTRARVLAERLGTRDDLVRQVEQLVAADGAAPAGLDGAAIEWILGAPRDDPEDLVGVQAGDYLVEALLSSGGMGHVYRALLARDGVERRVALKVLKRGLDTDALVARFHRERRTLAALHHDNVVSFLDAGALPDGRPFLVMEHVEGLPVTRWCDERRLPVRARVELFLDVLAAVEHAHHKLVVHRDLKPSNVLVTAHGVPKLLDFGVVALLAAEGSAAAATHIDGGAVPWTPGYASPEQLRGEPVTTASDVYSLGALLYELLAGVRAFPRDAEADPERVPPPPSSCAVEPGRSRELRGDLDLVVTTALHPDAARRYASVEGFAADLRLCLQGRPIRARPDSLVYRSVKFAARNRWPLALGATLVLALVAGWVGAEVGRRRATAEASRGWGAHREAKQVALFLEDLLAATTAGDWQAAVEAHESELDARFVGNPEAEGLARLALGRLWVEYRRPERAIPHLERVLVLAGEDNALGKHDAERARELLARARAP